MDSRHLDPVRQQALQMASGLPMSANGIAKVAAALGPEVARWAFSQIELRKRATAKFARAAEMLFDRDSLEMATHEEVADFHASFFPSGAEVVDVTSGIGSDLIALAKRGPAAGWELSEERVEMANHNLVQHGLPPSCHLGDGTLALGGTSYAFTDPARRNEGKRLLDPEDFSPNPVTLAQRFNGLRLGMIKLTPLLPDAFLESLGSGLAFVSFGGECREALVFAGSEAPHGRWAVRVETREQLEAGLEPPRATGPSNYIFDADPAAVRAHTLGHWGLAAVGDHPGYLTGPEPIRSDWLQQFRVLSHDRYDRKRLRATLRELSAGSLVFKQRGAGLDLQELTRELRFDGKRALTALFYREGGSVRVVVAEA